MKTLTRTFNTKEGWMKRKAIILTSLICICGILVYLSCGRDCPVCPKEPEPEPLGNYRLYAWDMKEQMLISFDIPADTIVDSVRLDYSVGDLFVTADGERVLLLGYNGLEVFNASDLTHIQTLDRQGLYYFDGTDNYAICSDFDKIYFIDPQTLEALDSISISANFCYLDTLRNEFWCYNVSGEGKFYRIDCETRLVIDSLEVPGGIVVTEFVYNSLTNDLYFQGKTGYGSYIFHYDLDTDSIINYIYITFTSGGIAHSPDLKKVYSSDGGRGMAGDIGTGNTYVFNALTNEVCNIIPAFDYSQQRRIMPFFGEDLIITPDGRRAYTGGQAGGYGHLAVIDLYQNKIIKVIEPYPLLTATNLAIGPIP